MQRGNYSPENVLLGLLERNTARHFRDEYLDIEIDVRPMSILLTANEALPSGSPLATRVTTLEVGLPTAAQMPGIVRAVDAQIREEEPGIARLFQPLPDAVVSAVAACAPRAMRVRLMKVYALAASEANRRGGRWGKGSLCVDAGHLEVASVSGAGDSAVASVSSRRPKLEIPLLVLDLDVYLRVH